MMCVGREKTQGEGKGGLEVKSPNDLQVSFKIFVSDVRKVGSVWFGFAMYKRKKKEDMVKC